MTVDEATTTAHAAAAPKSTLLRRDEKSILVLDAVGRVESGIIGPAGYYRAIVLLLLGLLLIAMVETEAG